MCTHDARPLTFETMLSDPLIRMVMDSDGVTLDELVAVLEVAREAIVAREAVAVSLAAGRQAGAAGRRCG
ncbi:hypothetical protein OL599_16625 [Rhodovastum sp. RN2-1]|uniref:Uncharacterized protein n=2 Tax=Limobrevibacterium gyesilva TaxID=2991712 RepID=A0AA42CGL9_9PROT|nr:hypothetical protein [Limobrevibacterium gyesilva]